MINANDNYYRTVRFELSLQAAKMGKDISKRNINHMVNMIVELRSAVANRGTLITVGESVNMYLKRYL